MDASRVVDTFIELVKIDSPSKEEALIANHLKHRLEQMGFEVFLDDSAERTGSNTGNLVATRAGDTQQHLVFSAHMDQVMPCRGVNPLVGEDGVIRTDGTTTLGADDKAGIASILEGIQSALESGKPLPRISILFTVMEEVGLVGARHVDTSLFDGGELTLVLDGGERPGSICIGAPFAYNGNITFTGKAAHAGVEPEKGVSAVVAAARAIAQMQLGRLDEITTANVGVISGGVAGNVVPPSCSFECECRSLDKHRADEVQQAMQAAIDEAAREVGVSVDQQWELEYDGYHLSPDDPVVCELFEAARSAGLEPFTEVSGGGSDANILSGKGLMPLVLGTGMTNYHTVDECVRIVDLQDTARFVEAIIYQYARR